MAGRLKTLVLLSSFIACATSGSLATANPVGDFFKKIGRSISHLGKNIPTSGNARKPTTGDGTHKNEASAGKEPDRSGIAPSVTPTPRPAPVDIRRAASAPPDRDGRRDVPYGVAVPNRPGLVTSPYAPTLGYVDVRGFPSSTEVLDPFTGKIFLTP